MKKILSILVLLVCLIGVGRAQQIITASITVTNVAGTANGETLTINSLTRTWTNVFTAALTQIQVGTNNYQAGTNLFNSYIISPFANATIGFNGSNGITLQAYPGGAMGVTISSGWGTVTFATNTIGTTVYQLRAPFSVATPVERTNIETALPNYLNDNVGSTTISTNAHPLSPWWTWINSISASASAGSTNSWSLQGNTGASGAVLGTMDGNALTLVADGNKMLVFDGVDQNFTFNTNNPIYNGRYHVILQGMSNEIAGVGNQYSIICDGLQNNNFANEFGFIGTGTGNQTLSYPFETILNGSFNTAHGNWTTILNGSYNYIGGPTSGSQYSTVLDGTGNYIAPNNYNDTIFVGNSNTINGSYSAAGGMNCNVQNDSVFMWSDNEPTPFNSAQSNTFLIRAQNGAAINTTNPAGYTLNVNGTINASGYYLNGAIFGGGTGGGGTNINVTGGAVGTLNYVNFSSVQTNIGIISNVVVSGVASYLGVNGGFTNAPTSGSVTYNYGGLTFQQWNTYISTNNANITFAYIGGAWILQSVGVYNNINTSGAFLVSPNFNNHWTQGPLTAIMTPTIVNASGTTTNSTVSWGIADNWYFSITSTTNFNLGLAQDWEATNTAQVENHKVFLYTTSAITNLSFASPSLGCGRTNRGWRRLLRRECPATKP